MAISFALDLTPNQIECLQQLDLYADGIIPITDLNGDRGSKAWQYGMVWLRKLIREGLVEHRPNPKPHGGGDDPHRYYRITKKGQMVLSLVEQDVELFLARQKSYQAAKRNNGKKTG